MILKNLLRRKGRTLLTVIGIGIGVAAILALGVMADGLETGYNSLLTGSQADLILSQTAAIDISLSSVDETVVAELDAMPEVSEVSGMLEGFVSAEATPFLFVFGHPLDSFVLGRFQIVAGFGLDSREARTSKGTPILLGAAAAQSLKKNAGDTIRFGNTVYRVIGIYETGDAFEDGGAVLELSDAQELVGKPRQVSLIYIRLKDVSQGDRLKERVARRWSNYEISGTQDFADKQILGDAMKAYVWVIAGMAIVIGGVGMMNAQLMAVMERTREIGVLRAVGWPSWRVLTIIVGESLTVGLIGGLLGVGLGWLMLYLVSDFASLLGANANSIRPQLLVQAFVTVLLLGLIGGLYPAWSASRLQPVEALRYEGGTASKNVRRLPFGGMAAQSLWQRTSRTLLTLGAIGLTVGSILVLEGVINGASDMVNTLAFGANAEIMIRQAEVADTSLSAIDEQVGKKLAVTAGIRGVSGFAFTAVLNPENGQFFIISGYHPKEFAIQKFTMVAGAPISNNRQIMLGKSMADSLNKGVGDTIEVSGTRFKVVGIYDLGGGFEELGGVITLRDAQKFMGRPRKVSMYMVKVEDPAAAPQIVATINENFPDVHAALSGEFAEQMPDFENANAMMAGISFLSVLVGGITVMNTMLMAVLERTREIGVMRALGWRSRKVLGLIVRESLLLGLLGGLLGIGIAFGLSAVLKSLPAYSDVLNVFWEPQAFLRAIGIALLLGLMGGVYPALRATRLQPVEALRYE